MPFDFVVVDFAIFVGRHKYPNNRFVASAICLYAINCSGQINDNAIYLRTSYFFLSSTPLSLFYFPFSFAFGTFSFWSKLFCLVVAPIKWKKILFLLEFNVYALLLRKIYEPSGFFLIIFQVCDFCFLHLYFLLSPVVNINRDKYLAAGECCTLIMS